MSGSATVIGGHEMMSPNPILETEPVLDNNNDDNNGPAYERQQKSKEGTSSFDLDPLN